MPASTKEQTFYRWVDEHGTVHVSQSLDAVPAAERERLQTVELDGTYGAPASSGSGGFKPDAASFALGFGAALLLSFLVPQRWRGVTRVVAIVGAIVLATGAYLGWIRRSTGGDPNAVLASPSALIQDAKAAVEKVNERQRLQQQELQEIEKESKK
jgi:hypothetical protein